MKTKILKALKTKVAPLGFNLAERQSIAETIEDNLNLNEGATDEEINAAIEANISAVLPFLQTAQTVSSRVINDYKEKNPVKPTEPATPPTNGGSSSETQPTQNDEPAWAKALRESNEAVLQRLNEASEQAKSEAYHSQLAVRLKGVAPTFYLREAKKLKFDNDENFEAYIEDVLADWTTFNQDNADKSLQGSATPANGGVTKTDAESIGAMISSGTAAIVESQK